jgi:N-acetylglutamate synthase-like GNAT family acetyltransferase
MIVPADAELRAVSVDPTFGRQGVGTSILHRLEQTARERGVARLNVASSINAEAFYGSTATLWSSERLIAFDRAMKGRASG